MTDKDTPRGVLLMLCGFSGWIAFLGMIIAIAFGAVENVLASSIITVVILFATLVITNSLSRERKTE